MYCPTVGDYFRSRPPPADHEIDAERLPVFTAGDRGYEEVGRLDWNFLCGPITGVAIHRSEFSWHLAASFVMPEGHELQHMTVYAHLCTDAVPHVTLEPRSLLPSSGADVAEPAGFDEAPPERVAEKDIHDDQHQLDKMLEEVDAASVAGASQHFSQITSVADVRMNEAVKDLTEVSVLAKAAQMAADQTQNLQTRGRSRA